MRILIVDDETLARDRLRRMLESDGRHEIIGDVGTGLEALRISEDLRPDLVLLDIRMPGMDGIETARHFLGQKRTLPRWFFVPHLKSTRLRHLSYRRLAIY